jgi:hypothetical protein
MARITEVTLDPLVIDVANVDIRAHASVTFNASDKDANTSYRMVATLVGHDFEGEFAEDAPGDVIPDGTLTPNGGQVIRADGLDRLDFDFPPNGSPPRRWRSATSTRTSRTTRTTSRYG